MLHKKTIFLMLILCTAVSVQSMEIKKSSPWSDAIKVGTIFTVGFLAGYYYKQPSLRPKENDNKITQERESFYQERESFIQKKKIFTKVLHAAYFELQEMSLEEQKLLQQLSDKDAQLTKTSFYLAYYNLETQKNMRYTSPLYKIISFNEL